MLETERLLLRPWCPEDRDAFRPIATDPEVMRYITGGVPWTDETIDEFIARQPCTLAAHGFCLWRLLPKSDPERLIGFCGLQPWRESPGLEIGYRGVIEIGWWLARDWWHQGYATEAARTVLEYGFETSKLQKVIAVAHKDNTASQRVAQRIGLTWEKAIVLPAFELHVFSQIREQPAHDREHVPLRERG